ncbi:DUF4260 family protein [Priestia megaterium]|uniref:DUF4260 family protein n=1 Tax=Priestia megaterium TaxID=1404 RepID=UPI001BEC8A9F|nr:DUF4260 family protein [Priestia megaterium]MBT2259209.1 DUF4260 family protein [Priestia megaterium]MBT2279790.1 DUF4260 family protein [Priestia megaterium]
MIKKILHLEALLVLSIAVWMYFYDYHFSLLWFLILLLSPDFAALGSPINKHVGAITYNFFHTYLFSVLFVILGNWIDNELLTMLGLIWTSHIAIDRVLGYGLKKKNSTKETHLQMFR